MGTWTFPAYTKPLADMVRIHDVNLHLYADDTQLYIGVNLPEADIAKEKLEVCVGEIRKWMAANILKLNGGKTEYMVIDNTTVWQVAFKSGQICTFYTLSLHQTSEL